MVLSSISKIGEVEKVIAECNEEEEGEEREEDEIKVEESEVEER